MTEHSIHDKNEDLQLLLRGVSEVISEKELLQKLQTKKGLRVKLGVDPTAPDLHLGHSVVLNKLKQFQDRGHTIVFIIGDLTARIGDPSGQSVTRPKLSKEEIEKNAETYKKQVFRILDASKTEVRFNSEWLDALGTQGMIELSYRYTLQRLIERDDFSKRIKEEKPISVSELLYPLLQGYDSVAVKADVEIGGTDQKFNLLVGRELQRDYGQEPQIVMTVPLLIGTDGSKKMSKSYGNYVAFNDPPKEMYGKLMSISDELMIQYYELLTNKDIKVIKEMHPKEAKMKLAFQMTLQHHGDEKAHEVQKEFEKVFFKNAMPERIEEYQTSGDKILLSHLLFESGLSPSKKESKRLIENGGVRIDNKAVAEDSEIKICQPFILQIGKRKFKKIIPSKTA